MISLTFINIKNRCRGNIIEENDEIKILTVTFKITKRISKIVQNQSFHVI